MPRIGARKLHYMLGQILPKHGISIGRNKLFDLLADNGMLVRRRKRRHVSTTDSRHLFKKYPNLIRELQVVSPNELWVSDITFIDVGERFCYLSLITDAYSRKIVGYCLYPTLEREGPLRALRMALKVLSKGARLIHHSDRGLQYCCADYVGLLGTRGITISMTENGDPYENAIAERVNGILKHELGLNQAFACEQDTQIAVRTAIGTYNQQRPHASCNYLTPEQAHLCTGKLKTRWKKRRTSQPVSTKLGV